MRVVVYGAGGIGGVIAARLHQHGHVVVAIARGEHLDVWRSKGLRVQSPDDDVIVDVPVVGHPSEVDLRDGDVVVLTMKSQDTVDALDAIAALAPDAPIVCAQNGVSNEREALRRFERAYGICVMMPTTFVDPGVVQASSAPTSGILDVGRFPAGSDDVCEELAAALASSTFSSMPDPAIMRQKHTKLLMNLGNSVQAVCGDARGTREIHARLKAEGEAALQAAGIAYATAEEDAARRGDLLQIRPIDGAMRGGGSTWQSFARGTGSIEVDHLNGEIVLLGRLHGVPTPANALLQRLANDAARARREPGFLTPDEVLSLLA
jgi:2-dehydropantoate 2-reductase